MAAITQADLSAAYKEMYSPRGLEETVFDEKARPFFTRVSKKTDVVGDVFVFPVLYEDVAGGSIDFATAQANVAAMKIANFQATLGDYHRVVQVKAKALRTISDLGSFLTQQKVKSDSMLRALANDIETAMYRTSSAWIGQFKSISTGVVTLKNDGEAKNFCVGDKIVAAQTLSSALRDSGAAYTITKIGFNANTFTCTGTISGITDGDYLFRQGDYVSASDTKGMNGLTDWITSTAGTFMGYDRSAHPERLCGTVLTGNLSDIEAEIIRAAATLGDYTGAAPDVMLCSYVLWRLLAKEMGYDTRRAPAEGKAGMGRINVIGPNGPIEVLPSPKCQTYHSYLLTMSTWQLISAGQTVGLFDDDGLVVLRVGNNDALEVRGCSYPQLICYEPGVNAKIAWA